MSPETILSPEAAVSRFLHSLVQPARILVAISGGSDSTGLLVALAEAAKINPDIEFSLCAATVDHDLRAGSADEARAVAALCQSLSIPHITCIWAGAKPKTGIMAAAREARYRLLADAAAQFSADLIVTAHTSDDQRETLAMREKRGGSPAFETGIADAMLFERRIWVSRPLLSSRREDIRNFLDGRGVGWLDDPSNEDMKYERVRTRAEIADGMPAPQVASTEARLQLGNDAADWLEQNFELRAPGLGRILPDGIEPGSPIVGYALARLAAVFGGQAYPLGASSLNRVLGFLESGEPGRLTAGRTVFDRRRDGLYLSREDRGILPLVVEPGVAAVWDGRFLIENHSPLAIRVHKRGDGRRESAPDPGLPRSAARRASAVNPAVSPADDANVSGAFLDAVGVTAYFAPFDRFLTRFDYIYADRLAVAFGTRPYPRPPLGLIDGKST